MSRVRPGKAPRSQASPSKSSLVVSGPALQSVYLGSSHHSIPCELCDLSSNLTFPCETSLSQTRAIETAHVTGLCVESSGVRPRKLLAKYLAQIKKHKVWEDDLRRWGGM